ncbi:hypothetical protein Efla_000860 [Eimeria flavescens]
MRLSGAACVGAAALLLLQLPDAAAAAGDRPEEEESISKRYMDSEEERALSRSEGSPLVSEGNGGQEGASAAGAAMLGQPGSESAGEEEEEEESFVSSEDYEAAVARSKQRVRSPSTSTQQARERLTPEEFEEAEREVLDELYGLHRFRKTTTTTPRPGFFKETALGVRNFFTAPVRAAYALVTRPAESFSANSGSASLAIEKIKDVAEGKEGSVGELARDWWRLFTMSPDREREAERYSKKAALEGDLASRNVMRSDGKTAEEFGNKLAETWQLDQFRRTLQDEGKSDEQIHKEFEARMGSGP